MTRLIPTREHALYSLDSPAAAAAEAGPAPFSPACYSRYKYGSLTATEDFAQALRAALGDRDPELVCAPRLLVTSSPYARVPTAATTLAQLSATRVAIRHWWLALLQHLLQIAGGMLFRRRILTALLVHSMLLVLHRPGIRDE